MLILYSNEYLNLFILNQLCNNKRDISFRTHLHGWNTFLQSVTHLLQFPYVLLHAINIVNHLSLSFFPFTAYLNGYGSWETISYASGPEGGCCLFRYLWFQIIQNGSCYTGCYFIESGFEQYGMNIFVFSLANNEMIFVHIKWLSIP